jgi:hypothetical protein
MGGPMSGQLLGGLLSSANWFRRRELEKASLETFVPCSEATAEGLLYIGSHAKMLSNAKTKKTPPNHDAFRSTCTGAAFGSVVVFFIRARFVLS